MEFENAYLVEQSSVRELFDLYRLSLRESDLPECEGEESMSEKLIRDATCLLIYMTKLRRLHTVKLSYLDSAFNVRQTIECFLTSEKHLNNVEFMEALFNYLIACSEKDEDVLDLYERPEDDIKILMRRLIIHNKDVFPAKKAVYLLKTLFPKWKAEETVYHYPDMWRFDRELPWNRAVPVEFMTEVFDKILEGEQSDDFQKEFSNFIFE